MVRDGTHLCGNEIVHLLTLGPAPYVAPGLEERFRHVAFFIGSNVRSAVQEGRADFMPVFLSEIPLLILNGRVKVDVAIIQVSPPDRHGFCSLGVSVDIVRAAVDTASLVLAEVNSFMPRTLGDSFIHVDRLARMVPVDDPLYELAPDRRTIYYYAHLDRYAAGVREGMQVRQGDVIGYVGMTGLATGPHLDYRIKKNGTYVNPQIELAQNRLAVIPDAHVIELHQRRRELLLPGVPPRPRRRRPSAGPRRRSARSPGRRRRWPFCRQAGGNPARARSRAR